MAELINVLLKAETPRKLRSIVVDVGLHPARQGGFDAAFDKLLRATGHFRYKRLDIRMISICQKNKNNS